jgi:hypothetical protein
MNEWNESPPTAPGVYWAWSQEDGVTIQTVYACRYRWEGEMCVNYEDQDEPAAKVATHWWPGPIPQPAPPEQSA